MTTKPEFEFTTDEGIVAYIEWLVENNLTYHFDDSIDSIEWHSATPEQIEIIREADDRLQKSIDIWKWFDTPIGKKMYPIYSGIDPAEYRGADYGDDDEDDTIPRAELVSGLLIPAKDLPEGACKHPNMAFEPDIFEDGERVSKHHWSCPDCGFIQVG